MFNYRKNTKQTPNTIHSLIADFENIGLGKGMTVIVHSSLKALGWVCGGPVAVVKALMQVIGEEGTIVMPTHSADLSEPSYWDSPPVPEEWWEILRREMPAFDPKTTPTLAMGKIVDCFRTYEGVRRSYHPTCSFAAWGKHRDYVIDRQALSFSLGEESPLQKIYDLDGFVLLLGVGYENNTSLHLAECNANSCDSFRQGSPIIENEVRVWKEYEEFIYEVESFNEIGYEFERNHSVQAGMVGHAPCRLIPQKPLVDFAANWLMEH